VSENTQLIAAKMESKLMANLPEKKMVVSGSFDDVLSSHFRLLEEATKLGRVTLLLWSDETIKLVEGHAPKFSLSERQYILQAVRYVSDIIPLHGSMDPDMLPLQFIQQFDGWVMSQSDANQKRHTFCVTYGLECHRLTSEQTTGFPEPDVAILLPTPGKKKVIVTGCYDWLHSGHIRFFEEASAYGDLYVAVGNDANVLYLKGEGHPLFPQEERRYMVQAIKYVKQAVITLGMGWMDAEPNIAVIQPDIYLVNEDGDKPEKAEFCDKYNLEYVVLKRTPKEGLTARSSTNLRGF
jgi:cytidyltransferase-like protein